MRSQAAFAAHLNAIAAAPAVHTVRWIGPEGWTARGFEDAGESDRFLIHLRTTGSKEAYAVTTRSPEGGRP